MSQSEYYQVSSRDGQFGHPCEFTYTYTTQLKHTTRQGTCDCGRVVREVSYARRYMGRGK